MSQKSLRASIVIPTWNRRVLLKEVLESLAVQTLPADQFEILVVDDCSTDGTEEMVRELAGQTPVQLRYHRMAKNVGAVPARNVAVRMTDAPILAFTDSDCRVVPYWLQAGLDALDREPGIAFVTGPVKNKPGQQVKFFSIGASGSDGKEDPIYPTCNVMYRSEVFWSVGGFDEKAYLRNSGGVPVECADADLAWRTKEAGHRNRFVPEMVVYHEVRQGTPMAWLAVQVRFMMVPELLRRHAGLREKLMWWGPFCMRDNLLFYIALLGLLGMVFTRWSALAILPFLISVLRIAGGNVSLIQFPKFAAQAGMLSVRQALICGALVYGSIRSRWLVL